MARVVPEDPYGGLAAEAALVPADLDLEDPAEPGADALIARAALAEEAALAVAGVTNSEGAEAGYGRTDITLVTSAGFAGRYARTSHSLSATALAGRGTAMQRERAIARLNPTRPKTGRLPVIYDPRVSAGLIGHLAAAVNGASVARGTTFLKDRMGERLFRPGITIIDDPCRRRGLRSRPFDAEGVPTSPLTLVENGVLAAWVLDSRSARQLGLATNGHAARGTSGPPSPSTSNLYLANGTISPAELMADITEGLYVTELIGMGINGLTGDYSRGAAGFMIRHGQLAEAVAEVTIAGTLQEIFAALTPANDLRFRRGTDAPTIRIDAMTLAGAG
jgi:PmbA protein